MDRDDGWRKRNNRIENISSIFQNFSLFLAFRILLSFWKRINDESGNIVDCYDNDGENWNISFMTRGVKNSELFELCELFSKKIVVIKEVQSK